MSSWALPTTPAPAYFGLTSSADGYNNYDPSKEYQDVPLDCEANTSIRPRRRMRKCKWICVAISVIVALSFIATVGVVLYKAAEGRELKALVNGPPGAGKDAGGGQVGGQQTSVQQTNAQQTGGQPTATVNWGYPYPTR